MVYSCLTPENVNGKFLSFGHIHDVTGQLYNWFLGSVLNGSVFTKIKNKKISSSKVNRSRIKLDIIWIGI